MLEKVLTVLLVISLLISFGFFCYFEFKKYTYDKDNYKKCEV